MAQLDVVHRRGAESANAPASATSPRIRLGIRRVTRCSSTRRRRHPCRCPRRTSSRSAASDTSGSSGTPGRPARIARTVRLASTCASCRRCRRHGARSRVRYPRRESRRGRQVIPGDFLRLTGSTSLGEGRPDNTPTTPHLPHGSDTTDSRRCVRLSCSTRCTEIFSCALDVDLLALDAGPGRSTGASPSPAGPGTSPRPRVGSPRRSAPRRRAGTRTSRTRNENRPLTRGRSVIVVGDPAGLTDSRSISTSWETLTLACCITRGRTPRSACAWTGKWASGAIASRSIPSLTASSVNVRRPTTRCGRRRRQYRRWPALVPRLCLLAISGTRAGRPDQVGARVAAFFLSIEPRRVLRSLLRAALATATSSRDLMWHRVAAISRSHSPATSISRPAIASGYSRRFSVTNEIGMSRIDSSCFFTKVKQQVERPLRTRPARHR